MNGPKRRTPALLATLAGRVLFARNAAGLSRTAVDAVLTRGHVWHIEKGDRTNLSANTAERLAGVLDVSIEWLLHGTGQGPRILAKTGS